LSVCYSLVSLVNNTPEINKPLSPQTPQAK
jgi:hypothetical protein